MVFTIVAIPELWLSCDRIDGCEFDPPKWPETFRCKIHLILCPDPNLGKRLLKSNSTAEFICPISSVILIANLGNYFTWDLILPSDKDTNQLIIRFMLSAIGKIWNLDRDKLYELTAPRLSTYLGWLSFKFGLVYFFIFKLHKCHVEVGVE